MDAADNQAGNLFQQELKTGDATFPHEPIEAAGDHGMPRHQTVPMRARGDPA